ncbi:MAG: hypothetical protein AAF349_21335 [Cyanobacteria bacterium P01_A01_bin.68]
MPKSDRKFRNVNRILGEQPRLGPFPADQLFPWAIIGLNNLVIFHYILDSGWLMTSVSIAWGWATYWTISSNKTFFGKFVSVPRLSRAYMRHSSLLNPVLPMKKIRRKKCRKSKKDHAQKEK